MNKQPVLNILKDIFQAYKYDVDSSYISDIVASKDVSDRIYIKLDAQVDYSSMRRFADSMKNTEGLGLYILNNSAPADVIDFASQQDLIFWDKQELERQIGRAILANATGETMELELARSEPIPTPEVTEDESIFSIFGGPTDPNPPGPKLKWPDPDTSSTDALEPQTSPPTQEEQIIRIPLPSFPINMAKTSAIKISQAKMGDVQDFMLKFIPFYSFRFDFETQRKFRSRAIDLKGTGEGTVNGITGEITFNRSPEPQEYVEIPTENYQIKEPTVSSEEALETALSSIIKKYTRTMKFDEMKGDAIIIESKTLAPIEKDVNISIQLVYVPIWEIQGRTNTIEINAYDGHVLEVPVDDDAEFV